MYTVQHSQPQILPLLIYEHDEGQLTFWYLALPEYFEHTTKILVT